jgi:tetratricopeptide (TPR) repeat protein
VPDRIPRPYYRAAVAHCLIGVLLADLAGVFRNYSAAAKDICPAVTELTSAGEHASTPNEETSSVETALNVSRHCRGSSHQSDVKWFGRLDPSYDGVGLGGESKLAWEKALVAAETGLMPIRTSSKSIAESLGLQLYRQRLMREAGPKIQQLASAAEETLTSPTIAAWALSNLAIVYKVQGRTKSAIALLEHALAVAGNGPQADHYRVGVIKNRLALYLREDGCSADAEIQFKQAISAFERSGDRGKDSAASVLHNLAQLYGGQHRYSEAAQAALSSLSLLSLGAEPDERRVFDELDTLGGAYYALGRYEDAEAILLRANAIAYGNIKSSDRRRSRAAANLALVYKAERRASEAVVMFNRALQDAEIALGPDDVWVGMIANRLAMTYLEQGVEAESELLFKRAIAIAEKSANEDSLFLSGALFNLSALYARQERYEEAESLLKRSLSIRLKLYDASHPAVEEVQNALSALEGAMHPPRQRETQMTKKAPSLPNNAER